MTLQTVATLLMNGTINYETSGFAHTHNGQDMLEFFRSLVGQQFYSHLYEGRIFCDNFHFLWTSEKIFGWRVNYKAEWEDGTPMYLYFIDNWE